MDMPSLLGGKMLGHLAGLCSRMYAMFRVLPLGGIFLWGVGSFGLAEWLNPSFLQAVIYAQQNNSASGPTSGLIRKIENSSERLEMVVNTSRILTLEKKIPQAQVNNPELLDLTALSPNQIQLHAKKAGVTQVNLWDENQQIYTIDVVIYGNAEELNLILRTQFPKASIKVVPISNGVLLSGYVDKPEDVSRIIEIAQEFYPKVISNITVGGVQQVLLHVKVMEVSRTKLRQLGFDWSQVINAHMIVSSASGLLASVEGAGGGVPPTAVTTGQPTFLFRVVDGNSAFFGVLEALRRDNLMKILAEPTLVTVSGRPAFFNVGGEFPILVPESLGTVSIEFKKFGTQVDFVPIVLGGGRIRLEVKPRVSEIDNTRSVSVQSLTVPGLRVREVDTGVELMAGQTLAIAGLVQTRVEAQRRGIPGIMELPYIGALFRKVEETHNEIELLILVTPELVDPLDPSQVPCEGPGMNSRRPTDWELYMRGKIEVAGKDRPRIGGQMSGCWEDFGAAGSLGDSPAAGRTESVSSARGISNSGSQQIGAGSPAASPGAASSPAAKSSAASSTSGLQGFIGPLGYEKPK
ncbi:MAG: type II and III secretion system protein family protein [Thermoguttaceae bacterium]|nr:type II and III secretion system protein family protein [Thermoguttaceae bacterium]MDW8036799.1 type II and III secretion system protein family protein [Thermoguttaceae bacterium]